MKNQRRINTICGLGMSIAMLTFSGAAAYAQSATVQGMIVGRDGSDMYVKTGDGQRQIVKLQDNTPAVQHGGLFGWGHKDLGVAALVPGLQVKVDGSFDGDHKLVAKRVEYSTGSMKTAKQIDAGLTPTNAKVAQQGDQIMSARRDIESAQSDIAASKQQIAANQAKEEADAAAAQQAINATQTRIGTLDQYTEKGSYTVNFRTGSTVVSQKDRDELTDFVKQAASTPGFMVQVQGYASKTGSMEMNQRLSSGRAEAVLAIIQQSGAVPMTRILAPAAMGVSEQVADNKTRAGRKQNQRVVVTIMVNQGITGGAGQQAAAGGGGQGGQQ
jgi:OOP family OmpA-OmpF porin